ncbi:MAG TPA: hypothetical protein VN605_10150 [Thermoanaerobaculia bacterium]|nr:hypothetical protein [Thermoanaerobaculia bacterium]
MRKPVVAKPRTATTAFSLSRTLPKLTLPRSAAVVPSRPRPNVGRPGKTVSTAQASIRAQQPPTSLPPAPSATLPEPRPILAPDDAACIRCFHGESEHPVRYVCDKYPHPDPLQICGCETAHLEELCSTCGHKARWHKPRHRCRNAGCHCWAFEGE